MRLRWLAVFFAAFGLGWLGGFFVPQLAGGAFGPPPDTTYADRLDFLRTFPMKADIAMLGDSLTQSGDWNVLFPGARIANLGISGDKVTGMLGRLDTVEATGARHIFLLAGVNDILRGSSVEQTFDNYRALLEGLRDRTVTIQSTFPTARSWTWANAKIRGLNKLLAEHCAKSGCAFVDLTSAMSANGELRSEFTNDGLHLNARGYSAWRDAIAPLVNVARATP